MRLWGFTTLIGLFCLAATPVTASGCGFHLCWGAVGIGPSGEWAWSTGYAAETAAVARVQNECPDCTEIETFYNGCGVIAKASGGAWGFAFSQSRAGAQNAALRYCSSMDKDCATAVWACSY